MGIIVPYVIRTAIASLISANSVMRNAIDSNAKDKANDILVRGVRCCKEGCIQCCICQTPSCVHIVQAGLDCPCSVAPAPQKLLPVCREIKVGVCFKAMCKPLLTADSF
mmetsp:Transcript_36983/g.97932  ORF Transcript_36983/g.97932 Transcript_36983/m.97932 type:complete len:109 (+) Transcript_36983:165-491(+)